MSLNNSDRTGCRDVWNASLVKHANYSTKYDLPIVSENHWQPNRLICFSRAIAADDYNQWVHFYEDDYLFERLWRQPKRYLPILKRFKGVISPDYSVYRDMPFALQYMNIYRSRALCYWLQQNGLKVIPNIRFGDARTYEMACDGIPIGSTIAIGTHGLVKGIEDRNFLIEGTGYVVSQLEPQAVVIYGKVPIVLQSWFKHLDIDVFQFDSQTALSHKKVSG